MASIPELTSRAVAFGDKVNGHPEYNPEVLPELLNMLDHNQNEDVLVAVIQALGHAWTESACLAVVPFANHPDALVRLTAVQSMPGGVETAEGSASSTRQCTVAAAYRAAGGWFTATLVTG